MLAGNGRGGFKLAQSRFRFGSFSFKKTILSYMNIYRDSSSIAAECSLEMMYCCMFYGIECTDDVLTKLIWKYRVLNWDVNHCVVDSRKERPPELFIRDAPSISHEKTFSIISMENRHFLIKCFIDSPFPH
jgi:hypothetical protein